MFCRILKDSLPLWFLFFLVLSPLDVYPADYDLHRVIPLRFSYQGADTLGWDKGTPWTPAVPFAVDFKGYLSMGNVPIKISVPARLVIECDSTTIYPSNMASCRAWVESEDDPNINELSSNYGFSLGIKFRDWWTETDLANIGKDFALIIQSDGPMPMGGEYLCGIDALEFASLPVDQLIPGSGQAAKAVRGIFSTIGDSGVDLNMASLSIAGELVVEGNFIRLIMADSDITFYGMRDPVISDPADDPNVKPFALTIPSEQSLADDPNYSLGSRAMFYEPIIQYSMALYNTAGLQFTLVPPLDFSIMPSAVDKGRNILSYACPDPDTLHNGAYYNKIADDFRISSDINTTVSFPLTNSPDLPDIAVTGFFVDGYPLGKQGKVFAGEWTGLDFQITNIGNRSTQGPDVGSPEPVFVWSLYVDGQPGLDIFGRPITMRKLDKNQDGSADWIDPTERPAVIVPQNESYLITGFTHPFTEGPHTIAVTIGYNEYKATENNQPVYGIGDCNTSNNMMITARIYANAPRGTVIGVIETNPCSADCGVNGIRVCLRDAAGGEYSECRTTGLYNERYGVYRFEHVPTGDYYLEYLPVKPTQEELDGGAPYYAPRSFYFHHERNDTDDFNYSTTRSGMWIYQYQILRGVVVDYEGNPLPEATVRLGGAGITATTDEKGVFVFDDVPPFRTYTLYFDHLFHKTKKVVFDFAISDSFRRETTLTGGDGWTPTYWDSDLNMETSGSIRMAQDLSAPTLYVEPLANQGYAGNTLPFQLRSADGDKDTYQYRYVIYDETKQFPGEWTSYAAPSDPAALLDAFADLTDLPEKSLSLVIEVRDASGNVTQSSEIAFTRDVTAPDISSVVLQDPATGIPEASYSKEVDVEITIGNAEPGTLAAQLSNDGGATWSDPFSFSGTSATIRQWRVTERDEFSGTKTVHVKVTDAAGNEAIAGDSITVDTTGSLYLAGGARYVNSTHVLLHIDIVPPDGEPVYSEYGTTGDFRLGSTASDQYRAQKIVLTDSLAFNKLLLSLYTSGTAPNYPFVGEPGPLHVKLVTDIDNGDPTCAACTTLLDWTGDRDTVYSLMMSTTDGLPIYQSQVITLNPGTYYLLVYAEDVDASNYYMLYANDYGEATHPSSPSFVYVDPVWELAPLSMMSNQVPHISFHLWNNDPGEVRIAEDGNCGALGEEDWEGYLFPDPTLRFVDLTGADGWKTVCVEYQNLSHPSSKDHAYYASVYLDTTLPTAAIEYPKVDPESLKLYFDLQALDDSGVEWILFRTVPGGTVTQVPYQNTLVLDASGLLSFSAVEFVFKDRAGNESAPTTVSLKAEDDFFAPSLEMIICDGSGFTTHPEITLHFTAQDNGTLSKILATETQTATAWAVQGLSGTSYAGDLVVTLPALSIDGMDTILDGVYQISAYAEDEQANRSKGVSGEIVLDRKAPDIGGLSLTSVTGRSFSTSAQFLMHLAAKDELGPLFLRFRINGGGWSEFQPLAQGENTISLTGPEPLPQEYAVDVEVKDGAGNTTKDQAMIRLNRPPSRPAVVTPLGTFFGNAPVLTLSAYVDPDGDPEAAVWFLVRKADDGLIVFNTGLLQNAASFRMPAAELSYDVGYTVTGSTMDSFGQWSGWSEPAWFTLKRPSLTVTVTGTGGAGTGTVMSGGGEIDCGPDCSEVYDPCRTIRLTALPGNDSAFVGWFGDGCGDAGTADCWVAMEADKSITARFALKGDLNGSGMIDLGDAILALQVLGQGLMQGEPFYPASVGGGPIGLREALFILQKLGGLR